VVFDGLVFSRDGQTIYASLDSASAIDVINVKSGHKTGSIPSEYGSAGNYSPWARVESRR
jgi:hypothetical protein